MSAIVVKMAKVYATTQTSRMLVNATGWSDEKMVSAFKTVGDTLAAGLNLHELKLRLIDHLNTKKEIPIN